MIIPMHYSEGTGLFLKLSQMENDHLEGAVYKRITFFNTCALDTLSGFGKRKEQRIDMLKKSLVQDISPYLVEMLLRDHVNLDVVVEELKKTLALKKLKGDDTDE